MESDSEGPHVCSKGVVAVLLISLPQLDDFRSHVSECALESGRGLVEFFNVLIVFHIQLSRLCLPQVFGSPEVGQLDCVVCVKHDVVRLNVSVAHSDTLMHEAQSFSRLVENVKGFGFFHADLCDFVLK